VSVPPAVQDLQIGGTRAPSELCESDPMRTSTTIRARRPPGWTVQHRQRLKANAAPGDPDNDEVSQGDVDESLEESFPASDPPSWAVRLRVGAPRRRDEIN
jgi:hypothetical protein